MFTRYKILSINRMITETESILMYTCICFGLALCGSLCCICQPLKRVRFRQTVEQIEYTPLSANEMPMEKIDVIIHI
jgi:hypothetical protein